MLKLPHSSQNALMKVIKIHVFPGKEKFSCCFDVNKTFGDLKNDLIERQILKKEVYYIELNEQVMNDDMIFKDKDVEFFRNLNILRNDYIRIKLDINILLSKIDTISYYMPMSDFKVIKADKDKVVKVCYEMF